MVSMLRRILYAQLLLLPAWLYAAPRVITLSPANTEIAFAAGIAPVAVSAWSDYPEAAKRLEQVASWQGINVERIIALKPDLVLAWRGGNAERPVNQLAKLGIRVLWVDPQSVEDIAKALEQLAVWSPTPQTARRAAAGLRAQWHDIQAQHARAARKSVFIQFGDRPLFTSGGRSIQNEVLNACGGKNIFDDSVAPWPQVSREQVLTRRPQAIVITGDARKAAAVKQFWGRALPVDVIALNADWFERAGPRIILAAQQLCAALAQVDE
ncbi:vitamin B12 ABC transporter substrate-binding protein BtuF [Enterobacteriaceae bacterium YMB-R22]|uniref:vitamin B12 ABC transporter substrate-binding protein BtuF n=1 Tax=Tenebrionicola larvae TaxID=2815733 RepID=UPI0020123268|nr:vitamin B12 ABC transporter substrate-binding protein BtuF [Tenebrionicola larvae]MBV4412565.1 vitamin B12 ABC transporter substrate-binding protein BtuF [Tenebrionicola larvae]